MNALLRAGASSVGLALLLFGLAARIDLPLIWTYCGLVGIGAFVSARWLDPELLAERRTPGGPGLDRVTVILEVLLIGAHLVVAGLDLRWNLSLFASLPIRLLGLTLLTLGGALLLRSMIVNPFFSTVVRIQAERGHHLIEIGPYRWLRHPGYAGTLLCFVGSGLALGSLWAIVPVLGLILLVLRRTAIEDRFLSVSFSGYNDYSRRVRWRLVPGLW